MATDPNDAQKKESETLEVEETIGKNTKIKVIGAFLLVAIAAGIAIWIQQPTDIKTDVLADKNTENLSQNNDAATLNFTQEVAIVDFAFTPASLTLKKGTAVNWTNKDAVPHTVTSEKFSSKTLNPGESFQYTFNEEGTFEYSCTFHPQMKGTIIVTAEESSSVTAQDQQNNAITTSTPAEADKTLISDSASAQNTGAVVDEAVIADIENPQTNPSTLSVNSNDLLNDQTLEKILSTASPNVDDTPLKGAALKTEEQNITKSGPEHIIYFLIGLLILHRILNRQKKRA